MTVCCKIKCLNAKIRKDMQEALISLFIFRKHKACASACNVKCVLVEKMSRAADRAVMMILYSADRLHE